MLRDSLWYVIQVFQVFIKKDFFKLFMFGASLQECIAVLKDRFSTLKKKKLQ